MSESTERLLGSGEVAAIFRVDSKTVSRWAREGKLRPPIRTVGGHYRYRESEIRALLAGDAPSLDAAFAQARQVADYVAVDYLDYDDSGQVTALLRRNHGDGLYAVDVQGATDVEALTAAVAKMRERLDGAA